MAPRRSDPTKSNLRAAGLSKNPDVCWRESRRDVRSLCTVRESADKIQLMNERQMKKAVKPERAVTMTSGRLWCVSFEIDYGVESKKTFDLRVIAKDATAAIKKAENALRNLGIHDRGDHFPYEELREVTVVNVSRGDWVHAT